MIPLCLLPHFSLHDTALSFPHFSLPCTVTVNFTICFLFRNFGQGADDEVERSMDSRADVCVEYSRRFHDQQAGGAHAHAGVAAIELGGAQSPERTIGWSACSFFDHAKS